jgi:hypothetical protein
MDVDEDSSSTVMDIASNVTEQSGNDGDEDDEDNDDDGGDGDDDEEEEYLEIVDMAEADEDNYHPHVPVIFPRQRCAGARNVATIKDGERDRLMSLPSVHSS